MTARFLRRSCDPGMPTIVPHSLGSTVTFLDCGRGSEQWTDQRVIPSREYGSPTSHRIRILWCTQTRSSGEGHLRFFFFFTRAVIDRRAAAAGADDVKASGRGSAGGLEISLPGWRELRSWATAWTRMRVATKTYIPDFALLRDALNDFVREEKMEIKTTSGRIPRWHGSAGDCVHCEPESCLG
jgi:hypothetical protein